MGLSFDSVDQVLEFSAGFLLDAPFCLVLNLLETFQVFACLTVRQVADDFIQAKSKTYIVWLTWLTTIHFNVGCYLVKPQLVKGSLPTWVGLQKDVLLREDSEENSLPDLSFSFNSREVANGQLSISQLTIVYISQQRTIVSSTVKPHLYASRHRQGMSQM